MGTQHFSLKWKNHQRNMLTTFEYLLSNEALVDVTLACEGFSLKAHKMILSASSPFFQSLFLENPCKHPIVIMKDIKFSHLKAIVEFVYRGEVNVPQDQLTTLLKTAETLKVKGLADLSDDDWQTATDQDNEKYYFTPLSPNLTQSKAAVDSNVSDTNEMQELSFPIISLEGGTAPSQATLSYPEFCSGVQSQFASSCSTFQQTDNKSVKHLPQENLPDTSSADLSIKPPTRLGISSFVGISKEEKKEPDACNNQTLLPHLVGMLSESSTQNLVTQGSDLSFPSTSSFGSIVKDGSNDSYLDYHDSDPLPPQKTRSRNNVLNKLSKKIRCSAADKPYSCNMCNKRFAQKSNLKTHQQTHSGTKLFKCEICGTGFTRGMDLARHHLIHTGEKPFACETCGRKFNRKFLVSRHERLVHRKVVT